MEKGGRNPKPSAFVFVALYRVTAKRQHADQQLRPHRNREYEHSPDASNPENDFRKFHFELCA
jgi:hypothetical protein